MGEIDGKESDGALVGLFVGLVVKGLFVDFELGEVKLGDFDG